MSLFDCIKRLLGSEPKALAQPLERNGPLAKVEMYSTPICPYCIRAKALLQQKGVPFEDFNVRTYPEKRQEMMARGSGRTVPQIFIDGKHIGGCDELYGLEARGELNPMLGFK